MSMSQETLTNPKPSRGNPLQEELLRRRATLKRSESLSGFGNETFRSNCEVRMGGTLDRSQRRTTTFQLTPPPLAPKKKTLPSRARPALNTWGSDEKMGNDKEGRGRQKSEQQRRKMLVNTTLSDMGSYGGKQVCGRDLSIPSSASQQTLDSVPVLTSNHYKDTNQPKAEATNPIAAHCDGNERERQNVSRLELRSKLEHDMLNQEVTPPSIPKRMESIKQTKSIAPKHEQKLDQPGGDKEGCSPSGCASRGKGREKEQTPENFASITPLGSSSESDYSGDGYVRSKLKSNVKSSVKKQQAQFELEKLAIRQVKPSTKAHPAHVITSQLVKTELENNTLQNLPLHANSLETIKASDGYAAADDVSFLQSTLKLTEFINSYSHLLPSQVIVQEATGSKKSGSFIAKGEKLLLHFIKKTDVVILNDEKEMYSIPVNSNVHFGIIYNPTEVSEEVSSYMHLPTIGDIMKLKQLPIIITALTSYDGGTPDKSVTANEILFIKGVVTQRMGGKLLHVLNSCNIEKFLGAKCAGNFSTAPHHMKLPLSTILSRDVELPQYVIVYPGRDLKEMLPQSMINLPVLLGSKREEISVVATRWELRNLDAGRGALLDLASELNMKVEAVKLSVPEKNLLKDVTMSVYENFEPTKCQRFSEKRTASSFNLQCYLYQNLLGDGNLRGMKLVLPACCTQAVPHSRSIEDSRLKRGGLSFTGSRLNINNDDLGSIQRGVLSSSSCSQEDPSVEITRNQSSNVVGVAAKQEDATSVSSHTSHASGNLSSSYSSLALNMFDSNNRVGEEDEGDPYEDIDDIRDEYEAEKKKIQEAVKQKASPPPSTSKNFANMFKPAKIKKLKKKENLGKISSEPQENILQGHQSHLKKVPKSNAHLEEKLPEALPPRSSHTTPSHTQACPSSESQDGFNTMEGNNLSENYECVGEIIIPNAYSTPLPSTIHPPSITPDATTTSSCSTTPSLPASFPPSLDSYNRQNMKSKLLQRPSLEKAIASEVKPTSPPVSGNLSSNPNADIISLPEHVMPNKKKGKEMMMGSSSPSYPAAATLMQSRITHEISGGNPSPPGSTATTLIEGKVTCLYAEIDSLKDDFKNLSVVVEKLSAEINGKEVPFTASSVGDGGKTAKEKLVEDNLRIINRMTEKEVLGLLDTMDLTKYKQTFSRERVNGSLLSMLDEATLKEELKVTSKLHRIRLLSIGTGQVSIHSLQK